MIARTPSNLLSRMPVGVSRSISAPDIHDLVHTLEGRTLHSVREFGAVGDGVADDTVALQAALDLPAWTTLFFPSGLYRTTAPLTVANPTNKRLVGAGGTNTTLRLHGSGDVLSFQDAGFCSVEELAFQHAAGSTAGNGVTFWGINGSNNVDRCFFAINPGHGLAFSASQAVAQSGNRVTRCLFLENGLEQLLMHWANDCVVDKCAFGGGFGPYSPAGCLLRNSSAGQYVGNEHWNNIRALKLENSDYLRIIGNRFEESRNDGVHATDCEFGLFSSNYIHTNSQSSSGTYPAIYLTTCSNWNFTGNQVMSWSGLRHKHSIELGPGCSVVNIVGNMLNHSTLAAIAIGSTTGVTRTGNSPASVDA